MRPKREELQTVTARLKRAGQVTATQPGVVTLSASVLNSKRDVQ